MSFQVPRSSRRTGGVGVFENTEGARNTENVVRTGKVKEVDLERRLLRVTIGEADNAIETAWLPVLEGSASATRGGMSAWVPPRINDVVQVACPGGELSLGVIMASQFMHANDAPFGDRAEGYEFGELGQPRDSVWRQLFADGTLIEYDKDQSLVRVETPGSVKVHACGQVIIKSPFIQLDADAVHVTGKLLLSDRVIGMNRELTGNGPLDFLGDPIKLNDEGGVFGIAGSLISAFGLTSMAGAIADFGSFDALFGGLVDGLGAPMGLDSFLGAGGLLGSIPADILGAGFNALGVPNVLGPLSNVMGFIQNPDQLVADPWGMAQFATEVASSFGLEVPGLPGGLPGVFDGFQAISNWVAGGEINVNQLVQVASSSGLLPQQASDLATTVGGVLNVAQQGGSFLVGEQPVAGGELTPSNLMQGLRSTMAAISDTQLANTINDNGVVQTWEMLFYGDVQPGQMIADFVNSGQISIEELLGINTPLQRSGNTDPSGGCGIKFNQPT
ncbi:MAG: phage baseplate assembly protein V [Synechococcus sp.]